MTETIIKRKIIKKRKKRAKKVKPTQEQKQTQIINIYNSGKLRNPLGIKRQKAKDKISTLETRRVYRPISINQHVNSFEVQERLYSKLADENRLNQISQQRERERLERQRVAREQEMKNQQDAFQQNVFEYIRRREFGIGERLRNELDVRQNQSFENEYSKGFGDTPLDQPAQTLPDPIDLPEEKDPFSGSTPQIAEPIIDVIATPPAGVETRPPTPPPEKGQAEIQTAIEAPTTIVDKFNSLTAKQKEIIKDEIQKKYPNTLLFTKKGKISSQTTINKQVKVTVKNDFNLIYNKLTSGQTIKKRGRPRKDIVV
jgi:hypothetical protein